MKSLDELMAVKEKTLKAMTVGDGEMRILVGMATCGIAAGARPVYEALVESVKEAGLGDKVKVTGTGCVGICQYEPVFEILEAGGKRTTYVKMTAERAKEVVEKHVKGGTVVVDYTIGASKV